MRHTHTNPVHQSPAPLDETSTTSPATPRVYPAHTLTHTHALHTRGHYIERHLTVIWICVVQDGSAEPEPENKGPPCLACCPCLQCTVKWCLEFWFNKQTPQFWVKILLFEMLEWSLLSFNVSDDSMFTGVRLARGVPFDRESSDAVCPIRRASPAASFSSEACHRFECFVPLLLPASLGFCSLSGGSLGGWVRDHCTDH
jgi:hypothetical protein